MVAQPYLRAMQISAYLRKLLQMKWKQVVSVLPSKIRYMPVQIYPIGSGSITDFKIGAIKPKLQQQSVSLDIGTSTIFVI